MAQDILVAIFLRGGCDGLNLIGPSADVNYLAERRTETRVERDGNNPGLPLKNTLADVDFRFHFKCEALKVLYDEKQLAIVHACGLTNGTRSHFEAQDYMERGTPENKNTSTGWLTRLTADEHLPGLLPVMAASNSLPASLLACASAVAVPSPKKIQLQGDAHFKDIREKLLQARYAENTGVGACGRRTFATLGTFASHLPKDSKGKPLDYVPSSGAFYPTDGYAGELTNGLKSVAQVVKMDIGLRVATVDYGGWDTHVGQGGRFTSLADGLSRSLAAFWTDMAKYQDRMTVVVMSEFGRRLKSNDSGGTDHGHGNMMLVLGGNVNGGNIYGRWPGLANEQLDNQVDLAVTTDYRNVLAEIAVRRFGHPHIGTVFPGLSAALLGIMKA